MALTQWCLGGVLRELVSSGFCGSVNTFHFLIPYLDVCIQDLDFGFLSVA